MQVTLNLAKVPQPSPEGPLLCFDQEIKENPCVHIDRMGCVKTGPEGTGWWAITGGRGKGVPGF